jgi:hypothetical protein
VASRSMVAGEVDGFRAAAAGYNFCLTLAREIDSLWGATGPLGVSPKAPQLLAAWKTANSKSVRAA